MRRELQIVVADTHVAVRTGGAADLEAERRPLGGPSWQLEPADLAREIVAAATAGGARNCTATLVLSSAWCYVHRFAVAHRRPARTMLTYALEEYLPLPSEQFTADFTRTAEGDYLGVAVETARLRSLLDALAAADIGIGRISLDILESPADWQRSEVCVWCDTQHVAVLRCAAHGLDALRVVRFAAGLTDDPWRQRVTDALELSDEDRICVAGCVPPTLLDSVRAALPAACERAAAAADVRHPPWPDFDLARDGLASSSQHSALAGAGQRLLAASLISLLVFAAGLWVYQGRIAEHRRAVADWERATFAQLFPVQAAPTGVALRLASERRRLEGLTLVEDAAPAETEDALAVLSAVIRALPAEIRVDLQEIRVEANDVSLRGRTRDHQQAERIAAQIDALSGLVCGAPRTNRLADGTVQFYLHAQHEPSNTGERPTAARRPGAHVEQAEAAARAAPVE